MPEGKREYYKITTVPPHVLSGPVSSPASSANPDHYDIRVTVVKGVRGPDFKETGEFLRKWTAPNLPETIEVSSNGLRAHDYPVVRLGILDQTFTDISSGKIGELFQSEKVVAFYEKSAKPLSPEHLLATPVTDAQLAEATSLVKISHDITRTQSANGGLIDVLVVVREGAEDPVELLRQSPFIQVIELPTTFSLN